MYVTGRSRQHVEQLLRLPSVSPYARVDLPPLFATPAEEEGMVLKMEEEDPNFDVNPFRTI